MESLANYGSDDEIDTCSTSHADTGKDVPSGIEGDNYDDVQMEMSENPLNGSKAPSVQAHSPGWSGGAPRTCATTQLESGSESASKEDDGICSSRNSNSGSGSSSSPASAVLSNDDESEDDNEKSKAETPESNLRIITSGKPENALEVDSDKDWIKPESNNSLDKEKVSEKNRGKDRPRDRERKEKDRDRERARERDDRDRRKDHRREGRHRSRSRDRRDRYRSPERSDRRRSRERDERRKSKERPSQDQRRRDVARRQTETSRKDSDRKRHRSRSRSEDRHRLGADSRSSSSSGSGKGDARSRELKATSSSSSGINRGSRSRSKSLEKDRARIAAVDSRKFFLEKKIDRKRNVLERMGIELKAEAKSIAGSVTPQMLVQRTMEQEAAQVKQATGVELPSYYNAAAVNPQRLVDQIQKRKLLWGAKKDDTTKAVTQQQTLNNKWQGATFSQDQDGKMAAKFNRLMGIKQPAQAAPESPATGGSEIIKKQEEMFHNMESQYEVARLATHTHRGLGLGFGTFQPR